MTHPTPQTTPTRDEAVPTGWKLVPVEPTPGMLRANAGTSDCHKETWNRAMWRAFLAASPEAPAPASGRVDAVAIKPLQWEAKTGGCTATGLGINYAMGEQDPGMFCLFHPFHTEQMPQAQIQAIAQADYEQRIRSVIYSAAVIHGPCGYLTIPLGLGEEHWRLSDEPDNDADHVSLPMFTKEDPFAYLPEGRASLSPAATPVSEAEPVAFPADGELLNMEDGERANEVWRWAKAAALPLHMAESGLNRFHEDDRTEWAWQAWCAALAKPASSPAGGDVVPGLRAEIAHDGFSGDIIGRYVTREGKRGAVVQQDGTRVVHVYGEKWLPVETQIALSQSTSAGSGE